MYVALWCLQSFDYDISPILQEIFPLKWVVLLRALYLVCIVLIESYYFLCIKKTIEQINRNMCLLIRKLFVVAYYIVQNIHFFK